MTTEIPVKTASMTPVKTAPIIQKKKKGKGRKLILVIVGGVLLACCSIFALVSLYSDSSSSESSNSISSESDDDRESSKPTASPQPPAPSFDDLHDSLNTMTEAQWENYASNDLIGLRVEGWEGTVYDVDQTLGVYTVIVDIQDDSQVRLRVSEEDALTYEKEQAVTVYGTIDIVTWILGSISLSLDNGIIAIGE